MRRSILRPVLLGLAAAFVVGAAVFLSRARHLSEIGAGYVAKQVCSCVFVSKRELSACRLDVPEDMDRVRAELLGDESGVRAWVPLLAERLALHSEGTGCTLR